MWLLNITVFLLLFFFFCKNNKLREAVCYSDVIMGKECFMHDMNASNPLNHGKMCNTQH